MPKLRSTLVETKRLRGGTTSPRQPLTGLDLFNGHVVIPVILVYKNGIDVELAQRALCQAMGVYRNVTGRIVKDENGFVCIDGNDAGVDFRIHKCEGKLPYGSEQPLGDDVKQFYKMVAPWQVVDKDWPLLQIDLYQYEDGGAVLVCHGTHSAFDGASMWTFMTAWTRFCQGLPVDPTSSVDRTPVIQACPPGLEADGSELIYIPTMWERISLVSRLAWRALTDLKKEVFRIPAPVMVRWLQDAIKELGDGQPIPHPAQLAAVFAMQSMSPVMPTGCDRSIGIVLDLRMFKRLKLPRDYTGNLLGYGDARFTEDDVRTLSLTRLAQKCRPTPEQMATETIQKILGLMEKCRKEKAIWKLFIRPGGDTLKAGMIFNNFCHFPHYDIDLGRGKPVWFDICPVTFRMLLVTPTPTKDGGFDLHLTARRRELEALRKALNAETARAG